MRKYFLIITLIFLSALSAKSQIVYDFEDDTLTAPYDAIGATFSHFSGVGVSYQRAVDDIYHYKTNFFIFYSEDDVYGRDLYLIIGAELQRNLHKTDDFRLYALFGAFYWYLEEPDDKTRVNEDSWGLDRTFAFGPGVGVEWPISKHVVLSADFGFRFRYSVYDGGLHEPNYEKEIYPGLGVSGYYRF